MCDIAHFCAAMSDKLPKDKDGMVALKDMHPMHHDMMHRGCEEMKDKKID
ncbi:MAG TPA: hypothetical protein VFI49_05725 [Rudaea sp.]|nr:hypothetical protein [Rudaea sp.]